MENSIVIDTCVLRLYDSPLDPKYAELFSWLESDGVLCISQKLLSEYVGTGNRNIQILLGRLVRDSDRNRLINVAPEAIKEFKGDKNFKYTCNKEDVYHSRLVFLSPRKKLISQDKKIVHDINRFKKVDGIKPEAREKPERDFYQ